MGAAEAAAQPASLWLIADSVRPARRSTAVSLYYAGNTAGQIVTFVLGGWVLLHFDWHPAFLIAGLPGVALAILLMSLTREPARGGTEHPGPKHAPAEVGSARATTLALLRERPLVHASVANMLSISVLMCINPWRIPLLHRLHGIPVSCAAIWAGLGVGVIQTVTSLLVGPVAEHISRGAPARLAVIPAIGCLGTMLAGFAMVLAPTLTGTLVGMCCLAFFSGTSLAPSYALILATAPADVRGSATALGKLATIIIGNSCLLWFTGAVSDAIGGEHSIRWALVGTLAFNLWATVHFVLAGLAAHRSGRASDRRGASASPEVPVT